MVNILRMDVYRILHGKSFWVFMALILAVVAMCSGIMAMMSSPDFIRSMESASSSAANMGIQFGMTNADGSMMDAGDYADAAALAAMLASGLTPMAYYGSFFLAAGGLTSLFVIFIAIFFAAEFESGFSKNVFTVQPNRLSVLGARIAEIVLLVVVFTGVSLVATLGSAALLGIQLASVSVGELALWGALVALALAGFGVLTALAVWFTRKMAAGIVIGCVMAAGLVTAAIQAMLMLFPAAKHVADFTLTSCITSLAQGLDGPLGAAHIALVSLAFLVAGAAISALVLQRKDV